MELFDAAQTQLATAPDPDLRPLWSWVLTRNLWLLFHVSEHIELDKAQLQTCQAIAQEHGDQALVAYCLWLLGHMCLEHDNVAAINYFEQSLKLYSDLDDRFYMAKAADFLAYAYGIIGRQTEHVKFSQQSLDIRRALGDQFGIAGSLFELAGAAVMEGQYAVAERYFREMEAIYHEVGSRAWMVRINNYLALLALQRGDFQSAQTQAEEAIAIVKSIGTSALMRDWVAHTVLSMLADLHEDYAQSWRLCEQGIQWSRVLTGASHQGFAIAACGLGQFETGT
jgi:tetratricopeptide (TPR) repeat protein